MINYIYDEIESNYTENNKLQYRKYLQFSYIIVMHSKNSLYIYFYSYKHKIMYYIYIMQRILYNTVLYVFKMWCAVHEVFRYKIEI